MKNLADLKKEMMEAQEKARLAYEAYQEESKKIEVKRQLIQDRVCFELSRSLESVLMDRILDMDDAEVMEMGVSDLEIMKFIQVGAEYCQTYMEEEE